MLLQCDLAFGYLRKIAEHLIAELTFGNHSVPFFAAYLSFIGPDAVEPES